MIHINLYATLRAAADGKVIQVELISPFTVRDALNYASTVKPKLKEEFWDANGEMRDYIKVFVNGRQTLYLPGGLDTVLQPDDTLDVFPPVGGGS